jgi:hypothetical protein
MNNEQERTNNEKNETNGEQIRTVNVGTKTKLGTNGGEQMNKRK